MKCFFTKKKNIIFYTENVGSGLQGHWILSLSKEIYHFFCWMKRHLHFSVLKKAYYFLNKLINQIIVHKTIHN